MKFYDILIIAVGLSMDAFAVSICNGLCTRLKTGQVFAMAGAFGLAQAVMPIIGYFLGTAFYRIISGIDHWVAFVLLVFLGVKMLIEAFKEESCPVFSAKNLLVQAIATSIDALAVGISFAALTVTIWSAAALIGCVTFLLSLLAAAIATRVGAKLGKWAQIAGGVILVGIGVKILVEHLIG